MQDGNANGARRYDCLRVALVVVGSNRLHESREWICFHKLLHVARARLVYKSFYHVADMSETLYVQQLHIRRFCVNIQYE